MNMNKESDIKMIKNIIPNYFDPFLFGRNYDREKIIRLTRLIAKSLKKKDRKLISISVNQRVLKKWDELAESIGLNRITMIHIAIGFLDLIINPRKNFFITEGLDEKIELFEKELERLKRSD